MIKLLISDLDGTLIHHHADMKPTDVAALRQAVDSGMQIAFASGRMFPETSAVMDDIGLRVHSISQNGAYVHLADGSLIRENAFERELLLALIDSGANTPFLNMLCGPDHYFVERMTAHAERIGARLLAPLHVVPDARERIGRDIACGKMSFFGDVDMLRVFRQQLEDEYGDRIDAYISDIDCMDVMPAGVSKGAGALALLERLGVRREETACVGDSFNDLSMFAVTPHSYAMAGSHPDVRARAAHTTASVADLIGRIAAAPGG